MLHIIIIQQLTILLNIYIEMKESGLNLDRLVELEGVQTGQATILLD